MLKFINGIRDLYNKYTFLTPLLAFVLIFITLWLNTKYVTKVEFSEHMTNDKVAIESFIKGNDSTHKEIMDFSRGMDKKIDAILVGKDVTLKQFELITLLQKKQDEEINDIKSRILFLERERNRISKNDLTFP